MVRPVPRCLAAAALPFSLGVLVRVLDAPLPPPAPATPAFPCRSPAGPGAGQARRGGGPVRLDAAPWCRAGPRGRRAAVPPLPPSPRAVATTRGSCHRPRRWVAGFVTSFSSPWSVPASNGNELPLRSGKPQCFQRGTGFPGSFRTAKQAPKLPRH